jgi:hypothetical protein
MLLVGCYLHGQNVGIGTTNPDPSAALDIATNNQGLLIPRTDTSNIANPVEGLMIYQNNDHGFYFHNGNQWQLLGIVPELSDIDNDTRIDVEINPDDDVIRFYAEGFEIARMHSKGLDIEAPGYSIFIGKFAGNQDNGTNNNNVFIGRNSGSGNTNGSSNLFLGNYSGLFNSTGSNNINIGANSGRQNSIGSGNTNIGVLSGYSSTGANNTKIGYRAGYATPLSDNVFIGSNAGAANNGSGNIFIGTNAGATRAGSNQLIIANSDDRSPLIFGDFSNDILTINGTTEIEEDLVFTNLPTSDSDRGIKFKEDNFSFMGMVYEGNSGYDKKIHFRTYDQGVDYDALTIDYSGFVGIGKEDPSHRLEVEAISNTGHIMKIKNTSTNASADGLEIELGVVKAGNQNHYITFKHQNGTAGRIEGFRSNAGFSFTSFPYIDFSKYFDLPQLELFFNKGALPNLTGGVRPSLSLNLPTITNIVPPSLSGGEVTFSLSSMINCIISAGAGCSNPLSVTPISFDEGGFNYTTGNHNWNRGQLPTLNPGSLPSIDYNVFWNPPRVSNAWDDVKDVIRWGAENGMNFLGLDPFNIQYIRDLDYWSNVASVKDGGVTYGSLGADYAEWLERENKNEVMRGGQIVSVKNGKISLQTNEADQLMVVSIQPVVLGNMPDSLNQANFEKIAFIGQAPTWVVGKVSSGDYIIPSGEDDGYGIAINPEDITLDQVSQIVGRAWEDGEKMINLINMAVGLKTNEMGTIMKKFQTKFNQLDDRVEKIEAMLSIDQ